MVDFPTTWRDMWNDWDVRVFVLISLLMQMLLIIFAPLRRRKSSRFIILFVWSIYLLADWVAIFSLGLLCNGQGKSVSGNYDHTANARNINNIGVAAAGSKRTKLGLKYDEKLTAFWAPFLLLHLGGPDAITAFAMEDNELWIRHFLGALIEVGAAVYAFLQSLPKNELLVPTILMFLAGIIKYGERTYALYLGSLDGFRHSIAQEDNPGPDYEKLIDKQQYMEKCGVKAWIHIEREGDVRQSTRFVEKGNESGDESGRLHDLEGSLIVAYKLFNMFKGILVDLIFGVRERNESRQIFLHSDAGEAFRIVELELSFLYEVLFTKAAVVHHRYGYVLRAICLGSIMAAFVSFFFVSRRHAIDKLDLAITYTLLGGAICLDIFGLVCLILSDWTVVKVKRCRLLHMIFSFFLRVQPHDRWSVTVTQHSLINYCIPKKPTYLRRIMDRPTLFGKVDEMLCIQKMLRWTGMGAQLIDEIQYTWHEDVTDELKKHIYKQLKKKAWNVESGLEARNACSCRGDRALEERGYLGEFRNAVEVEFHESLILWHLATDLCYYIGEENDGKDKPEAISQKAPTHRPFCKLLSDYLMYLLVMRPSMMSSSALLGKIRYRDTCAEAKRFFLRGNNAEEKVDKSAEAKSAEKKFRKRQIKGCKDLLSSISRLKLSGFSKEDESKSLLFDGCALFEKLKRLKAVKRWELMSEVWIEMLAYAASRCPSIAHAQMLSQGGELLSFVWLLLTHLGMGEHYQISNGPPRAKLMVVK